MDNRESTHKWWDEEEVKKKENFSYGNIYIFSLESYRATSTLRVETVWEKDV